MEDRPAPSQQVLTPTLATSVDELVKAAYFVAASIDVPLVEIVSQHHVNVHYPADGSLVSVKVEGRPGAWGGIAPHGTPEEELARNTHYDEQKAAAAAPPPEGGVTSRKKEDRLEGEKKENHRVEHKESHKKEHSWQS